MQMTDIYSQVPRLASDHSIDFQQRKMSQQKVMVCILLLVLIDALAHLVHTLPGSL